MTLRANTLLPVLAATLALAGCSNTPGSPSSLGVGRGSSDSVAALASPDVAIFSIDGADTSSSGRGPCVFDPETGQFVCPDRTRNGITLTMRFTLYDANGNVQSRFDRATTAAIRTETTATGTTSRQGATITINRSGVMMTTGLGPTATTHTLNGSEQGTIRSTQTTPDGTVTTETSIQETTTNLVVPVRARDSAPRYPLSGVRVRTTVATTTRRGDTRTVTTRRQETFNGTNIVQIELTVNGVTEYCTFDLDTRTSTCGRR